MPSTTEEIPPNKGKETDTLRLAKLQKQRQELVQRLDQIEADAKDVEVTYRWCLLTLCQLFTVDDNQENAGRLEIFKRLVKNGDSPDVLKTILLQAKDTLLKQEIKKADSAHPEVRSTDPPKKPATTAPSLLNWLRKTDKIDPVIDPKGYPDIALLKETYLEIIDELRLNLDENALEELRGIEKTLKQAFRIDDFPAVRKSILNLIKKYISRISKEREDAASFIREIGERLIEVEGHMVNSLSFAKDAHQLNASFTDTLEAQLADFKQSVDTSQTLSELKTAVVTRLFSIKTVIESKRRNDSERIKQADLHIQALQQNLSEMRGEIEAAWQRAKKLERALLVDPLTGIYNRRAYDLRMIEEIQRYHRYQRIFSLLVFDVDLFKRVNDRYGHSIGDMCLKEIIHRIKPVLRKSDFPARYGGEEFVVIAPETRVEGATDLAEKIRRAVELTQFVHKADSVIITVSIGVTEIMQGDETPEDIFSRADKALYTAKQSGRNRVIAS